MHTPKGAVPHTGVVPGDHAPAPHRLHLELAVRRRPRLARDRRLQRPGDAAPRSSSRTSGCRARRWSRRTRAAGAASSTASARPTRKLARLAKLSPPGKEASCRSSSRASWSTTSRRRSRSTRRVLGFRKHVRHPDGRVPLADGGLARRGGRRGSRPRADGIPAGQGPGRRRCSTPASRRPHSSRRTSTPSTSGWPPAASSSAASRSRWGRSRP